jgi:hypothetical protein
MMRCQIFTDPLYHAERSIEFDPAEVMAMERKTFSLFLRGKYEVTYITLKNGMEYALEGDLTAQIEAAKRQARAS